MYNICHPPYCLHWIDSHNDLCPAIAKEYVALKSYTYRSFTIWCMGTGTWKCFETTCRFESTHELFTLAFNALIIIMIDHHILYVATRNIRLYPVVTNLVAQSANGPIFTAVAWDTAQPLRQTPVFIFTLLTLFTSHKGLAGTGTRHRVTVTHCSIGIALTSCDIFKGWRYYQCMIRYSFYFLLYYVTVAGQANAISKIWRS